MNKIINVFWKLRGAKKNSWGGGVHIFETMCEVLKLHLETGSDGSETSFRRNREHVKSWGSHTQATEIHLVSSQVDAKIRMKQKDAKQ